MKKVNNSDYIYITTPMYYVNGDPHLGHSYSSIVADFFLRFFKLNSKNALLCSGTDEHGKKIMEAAKANDKEIEDFIDTNSIKFRNNAIAIKADIDVFVRTSSKEHKFAVTTLWKKLLDAGKIYLGEYSGWYAIRDESFYSEDELEDGKAPTGALVEWISEKTYFFSLSSMQEKLLEFYESHPNFVYPSSRMNEVISFVKSGLRDLAVSRRGLQHGIRVHEDQEHAIYVWLDALTSYISGLGFSSENNTKFLEFWENSKSAKIHVVGKDILRFHAVFWPAFLMAANLPLPDRIISHGWWISNNEKMSKSIGNVVNPEKIIEKYGVDALRYFVLTEMPLGNDGNFSDESITTSNNSNLANSFGNLYSRVISFVTKHFNNCVPSEFDITEAELPDYKSISDKLQTQLENFEKIENYIKILLDLSREANALIEKKKPWATIKTDIRKTSSTIYSGLEYIRIIFILLQPITPEKACEALDSLCISKNNRTFTSIAVKLEPGYMLSIKKDMNLFPRIQ